MLDFLIRHNWVDFIPFRAVGSQRDLSTAHSLGQALKASLSQISKENNVANAAHQI